MKELSLNILDIVQNSIKAGADLIRIWLTETEEKLTIEIIDDGCGMSEETAKRVRDPFYTTRKTRKVGMGIPFFALAAEQTGGGLTIQSSMAPEDHGTTVTAVFYKNHLDFTELGDMEETLLTLVQACEGYEIDYRHTTPTGEVVLSTAEMRAILGEDVPLNLPEVLAWIREYLREQYANI